MGIPVEVLDILKGIYDKCADGPECPCKMPFDPKEGLVPRGVTGAWTGNPDDVKLVVVGMNPGRPVKYEEEEYSKIWDGDPHDRSSNLAQKTAEVAMTLYLGRELRKDEGPRPYHRTLMEKVLAPALGYSAVETKMLNEVYFTELMKCSTKDRKKPLLVEHRCNVHKCGKYLRKELEIFNNAKAILALGRDVDAALLVVTDKPVVWCPHPSRPKNSYPEVVKQLKDALGGMS